MQDYTLKENQELRFFVGDEPVKLELRRGLAEVYGTEMLINKTYVFPKNSYIAVFTYHGATFEMSGTPLKCHIGQKCDYMPFYLGLHGDLERMREQAEVYYDSHHQQASQNNQGDSKPTPLDLNQSPICLICKPAYSGAKVGKSTLCRVLLNYAARRGRAPVFVNLDPERGMIGLPGTIGALSVESQIDIESGLALKSPMLLHFGSTNPEYEGSTLLYKTLVENLANIVRLKLEQDKKTFSSGIIINACSWKDDTTNELLLHACKSFNANVICVMDDEVLKDDLQQILESSSSEQGNDKVLQVINTPKTVSIIARAPDSQVELRYKLIKEYFYGTYHEPYNPMTSEIKFSFIKNLLYTIRNPLSLPDALMPLGSKSTNDQLEVVPFKCKATDLRHMIISISHKTVDELAEDSTCVLRSNVLGFVCVTDIRKEEDLLSILAPQKLPIPMNKVLLVSQVIYADSY